MDETRRLQIYNYLQTFFRAIREFIQTEDEYRRFVPQLFRFAYLFLVYECKDGYLVAAYPSGIADNFIYIDYNDRSAPDVLKKLPNLIMNSDIHVVINIDGWGGSGLISGILDRAETSTGSIPTTGWKFFYISTRDFEWPLSEAKKGAAGLIATIKARALVYQPSEPAFLSRYDISFQQQDTMMRLSAILKAYREIITEQRYRERVIHHFLHENPVMLFPTKKRMVYEYPLKDEDGRVCYKVDFVIELTTGRYVFVELENPNHPIFTSHGDFRAIINHAEDGQILKWMHWLRRNLSLVEKDLPGIVAPEGLVIVGRSAGLDSYDLEQIRMHNEKHDIKLMTYDDLAEEAENHIRHILDI
ncbi:MAG TPA: Shedu anti-phage system protein SduA domain-containing protein [Aggregatilineaceae bacterium]|nr:Shedu anti-phage system protein SduA domain-containing protein [Aggregatilineaceae bacterium]